jgi:hypothetical protein
MGEPSPASAPTHEDTPQETAAPVEETVPVSEAPDSVGEGDTEDDLSAGTENLWADLAPFAIVPGELAQEGPLRDRARLSLDPTLATETPLMLEKPFHPSLLPIRSKSGESIAAVETPLLHLDFLIHSPNGSYAWFGGRRYRTGETLMDGRHVVKHIGTNFVELAGPNGKVLEYTNLIPSTRLTVSDKAEAP